MNPHNLVSVLRSAILSAGMVAFITQAAADNAGLPFVSPIFGDHMVLQRGKTTTIWGWTTPGQTVRLEIAGRTASGVAGTDGRWVGPRFTAAEKIPGALKLRFDQNLIVRGDMPEEFAIAGDDRKWQWADAKSEVDSVVVSSPEVINPTAARYAWHSNPKATLFNTAGLPAVPFRTDPPLDKP